MGGLARPDSGKPVCGSKDGVIGGPSGSAYHPSLLRNFRFYNERVMLEIKNIELAFGGLKALQGFSMTVEKDKIFSLIGPNGAGKTTLFNVVGGSLRPDSGSVVFMGKDITRMRPHEICREGIARTYQLKNIFPI